MTAPSSVLEMRRRSVWEAADSGILLWRENISYFIPFFALPVWTAAFAFMLIPGEFRWVSWLGLWWFKPLFDRLCLRVTAFRFFRNKPGSRGGDFREMLRGLSGAIFPCLLGDLLWRRFSPFRPATMALRILEHPGCGTAKKSRYNERKKALVPGGLQFGALISCLGLALEIILLGGEIAFALVIYEMFFPQIPWTLRFVSPGFSLFVYAAYCFNYILAGSLCVSMGFGVYINSRTEVEGWDLELLFKKFSAQKISPFSNSGETRRGAGALLLVLGFLFLTLPPPLEAEDLPPFAAESPESNYFPLEGEGAFGPVPWETLEEILASPDFGGTRPAWRIQLKEPGEIKEPENPAGLAARLAKLKEILALGLRAAVILILAGFFLFALAYGLRFSKKETFRRNKPGSVPSPVSPENPEALFEKAEELFRRGLCREAWAVCLWGTINAYGEYFGLSFPPGATEYDCLSQVEARFRGSPGNPAGGFGDLVSHWVLLAYGHRDPGEGSFERALGFGRSLKTAAALLPEDSGA